MKDLALMPLTTPQLTIFSSLNQIAYMLFPLWHF